MRNHSAGARSRSLIARIAVALTLLPFAATASPALSAAYPVSFRIGAIPAYPHSGEVVQIVVKAAIAPGWHLYSLVPTPPPGPAPTVIDVAPAPGFISEIGTPFENAPISKLDPNFGKIVSYHVDSAIFGVPVRIASTVGKSALIEQVVMHYQVCNDSVCLPPTSANLEVTITADDGPVRSQYARMPVARSVSALPAPAGHVQSSGLGSFVIAAFIAGLLALLTPCVFPLIPVTFGFFTKQVGDSHRRLIVLAGAYALGIIVSFTLLGLVAALTFGAAGANRVAANPWFNLFFGALFVVFAFSFFEAILITLPPALSRFARPMSGASGLTGVLFMGLAFVFAAFTCTAPFIGTILVAAASATGAAWVRPLLGMLVFALALALPFFLLALFPSLLTKLPRSGGWMTRFKATLGFVELAYALTYFSKADLVWQAHILTASVILSIWAALSFGATLYLLGLLRVSAYPDEQSRPSRWSAGFAALFAFCGCYCLYALTGRPVSGLLLAYLPPTGYGLSGAGNAASSGADLSWLSDYDQAVAQAKSTGKPIFIDFTGYTCTNCRYVEQNIFPKSPVSMLLAGSFTRLRLYTDGGADGPANEARQQGMFGTVALPLYAIVSPAGQVLGQLSGSGHSLAEFAQFMTGALQAAGAASGPIGQQAALWQPFSPGALSAGKPAIVDFTASWCTNCHALERTVFTAPAVTAQLGGFATYRVDLTDFYSAKNAPIEKQYSILQLPAVLFFDSSGKEVAGTRVTGLISAQDFAGRMQRALAATGVGG